MSASLPVDANAVTVDRSSALPGSGPTPRFRVLLGGLAMRVAPEVNASLITKLDYGRVVDGLPEQSQGYWTAVEVDGKRGWVATQWLLPQGVLRQP